MLATEFGREEGGRPSRLGRSHVVHVVRLLEHLGHSKVHHLEHVILGQEQVVWLDVAVDDAVGMQVLDAQYQVSEPVTARLLAVRIRRFLQPDLHDHALLAHLHDHVERVLLRVVQHLDELYEIGMVQLLHDGDLLADQIERVSLLAGPRTSNTGRQGSIEPRAPERPMRPLLEDVGLRALP